MNYKIGDKCIKCFACIRSGVCRQGAIVERNGVYLIDNDKCTDCGKCFEVQMYFCPMKAIVEDNSNV